MRWFGPEHNILMLACYDGGLRIWHFDEPMTSRPPRSEFAYQFDTNCTQVAFDPRSEWMAACSEGSFEAPGHVVVWRATGLDLTDRPFKEAFRIHKEFAVEPCTWCVALLRGRQDEVLVAIAGKANDIRLWDVESRRVVATLCGHRDSVFYCQALTDRLLVSASRDGTVRIWDAWEREELCILHAGMGKEPAIAVRDGRIAICDENRLAVVDVHDLDRFIEGNAEFEQERLLNSEQAFHLKMSAP
jgi:WD40 repeat protein